MLAARRKKTLARGLRAEGGVYRPSLEPRQKWPEPFAQNWAVGRSVGEQKCFFGRQIFTHVALAAAARSGQTSITQHTNYTYK